eukprot:gene10618-14260_t
MIKYREISTNDFAALKSLHEEFFPVRYSDSFYNDVCNGIGVDSGHLFTQIAICSSTNEMIGFVLAQFVLVCDCEDKGLFDNNQRSPKYACYILTLGLKNAYRRSGLGSKLIEFVVNQASENESCGAVYLHVIHHNHTAIKFYKKNNFERLRILDDFYLIDGEYHRSYLYICYINGFKPPLLHRFVEQTRAITESSLMVLSSWITNTFPVQFVYTTIPQFIFNFWNINHHNHKEVIDNAKHSSLNNNRDFANGSEESIIINNNNNNNNNNNINIC